MRRKARARGGFLLGVLLLRGGLKAVAAPRLAGGIALAAGCAVALDGGRAGATSMLPLDLQALVERSEDVVHGTVEGMEARWTRAHDAIYTDVRIRVGQAWKGGLHAGDVLTVRREGGTVDGISMRVFGSASFTAGEEVVVFAVRRAGVPYVVGMAQGKLRVTSAADGKKQALAPDTSGIAFVRGQAAAWRPRPLEELEQIVRTYATGRSLPQ